MNISLSKGKSKKKKLGFGLNRKNDNVLGGDDDSDEESDDNGGDDRAAVNRDLRAEQEALKKRAAATLDASIYDYDGVYDSLHAAPAQKKDDEKKSRYIGDLLQAAKRRDRERDVIKERKISKEQAQEEADFQGKDKFVTKAYKRKLAERELWAQEEEARQREEEENEVTKKTGDGAFASFYGNLNRNVAMGGGEDEKEKVKSEDDREIQESTGGEARSNEESTVPSIQDKLGFLDGFEQSTTSNLQDETESKSEAAETVATPLSMRKAREEKVAKARLRYFQRQGLSEDAISQQKQ